MNEIKGFNTNTDQDTGDLAAIAEVDIRRSKLPIMNQAGQGTSIAYIELLEEISEDTVLSGSAVPDDSLADENASQVYFRTGNIKSIYRSASGETDWTDVTPSGLELTVSSSEPSDSDAVEGKNQLHLRTDAERALYYSLSSKDTWSKRSLYYTAGTGINISTSDEISADAAENYPRDGSS